MLPSSSDPYYVVKDEVDDALAAAQAKLRGLAALPPTAAGARAARAAELADEVDALRFMLSEVDKSVDAAERNPARFGVPQAELSARRQWAMATRRAAEAVADAARGGGAPPAPPPPPPPPRFSAPLDAGGAAHDGFAAAELGRQAALVERQDEDLDALGSHVVRIGELGREMGQELRAQSALLDELGEGVDGVGARVAAAQRKVQAVLDRAGARGQLALIAALLVLLVVLLFLLVA